jgi:hypothetical protein
MEETIQVLKGNSKYLYYGWMKVAKTGFQSPGSEGTNLIYICRETTKLERRG